MNLDNEKVISFLLSEAFLKAPDKFGKNFNKWCEEKGLVKTPELQAETKILNEKL